MSWLKSNLAGIAVGIVIGVWVVPVVRNRLGR
jgi:hypothetical protein